MRVISIAKYTFIEVFKSRIIYNTLFLGVILLIASFIAREFTYGVPERVALDFGLGLLTLSSVGMGIFFGSTLISKEIEGRTIYMILSRPVKRWEYLIGRILGMITMLIVNILILSLMSLFVFWMSSGNFFDSLIYWAILFAVVESVIILCISVLFSMLTNVTMSTVYTILIYILGHSLTNTTALNFAKNNPVFLHLLEFYGTFFPNFSKLNIKNFVLFENHLSTSYLVGSFSYGIIYIAAIMLLSVFILNKKDLT